jgi:type I restriction enzyme S subunit
MVEHIQLQNTGSSVPLINLSIIRKLPVPLPPLPEHRAIAGILGALDDKIELNRRMNRMLESMARAVFRQWFVEDKASNDWEEKSLDEIADFLNGLALQKFPASEGDDYLPVIKIAQLRTNNTENADRANTDIPPQYVIEDGDILFSWSGSLTVVAWCGGKGALNQHLFKVTSEKYPKWFYYLWTKHHLPEFQAIAAGKATTMGHIQRHHLRDAKVLVPSDKELKEMDKVMSPILEKIINNEKESRTLASLRDTLLPKLMKGEVRVKDEEG